MNQERTIMVGVVENDPSFRDSLEAQLKNIDFIDNITLWVNAEKAYRDLQNQSVDILFVDIGLPGMSGSDLVAALNSVNLEMKILMLTSVSTDDEIMRCLKQGAIGYLLKGETLDLKNIIGDILDGGAIMTPSIAARVVHLFRGPDRQKTSLTSREMQILEEIINGYSTQEIANMFGTQEGTVRQQIKSIYSKLQVHSRVQLVRKANELGLF